MAATPYLRSLALFVSTVSTGRKLLGTPASETVSAVSPLLMTCTAMEPSVLAKAVTFSALPPVTEAPTLVAPARMNREPK